MFKINYCIVSIVFFLTSTVFAGPIVNPDDPLSGSPEITYSDIPSGNETFSGDPGDTQQCGPGFKYNAATNQCVREDSGGGTDGTPGSNGDTGPSECSPSDPKCNPIIKYNPASSETEASLGISSPFTNAKDSAFSKATVELQNNMTTSELALANATMHMVEPAFAAAMADTMKTSLGLSENRYLASMHTRNEIDHADGAAKAQGEIYQACIAQQIKSGKRLSESQEVCMGGTTTAPEETNRFKGITPWEVKEIEDHPKNMPSGVFTSSDMSLLKISGTRVSRISSEYEKFIMLSDLIFNRHLAALKASNNAQAFDELKRIRFEWENTYGDIAYSIAVPTTAPGAAAPSGVKIKFQYMEPNRKEIVDPSSGDKSRYWPESWPNDWPKGKPQYTDNPDNDNKLPNAFELVRQGKRALVYNKILVALKKICVAKLENGSGDGFQSATSSGTPDNEIRPQDLVEISPQGDPIWVRRELLEKLHNFTAKNNPTIQSPAVSCNDYYTYNTSNTRALIPTVQTKIEKGENDLFVFAFTYADAVADLFMIDKLIKDVDALKYINQGEIGQLAVRHVLQLILSPVRASSPEELQQLYIMKRDNVFAILAQINRAFKDSTGTTGNTAATPAPRA